MHIFYCKLRIDLFDIISSIPFIVRNTYIQNKDRVENKEKSIDIIIDIKNYEVIINNINYNFYETVIGISYDVYNDNINVYEYKKEPCDIINNQSFDNIVMTIYFDKSEEKLYILELSRTFVGSDEDYRFYYVKCNVNFTNTDNYANVYKLEIGDTDLKSLLDKFSNMVSYKLYIDIDNITDYEIFNYKTKIVNVDSIISDKYLELDDMVLLRNKSGDYSDIKLKLFQFNVDETANFIKKFDILDENNDNVNYIIKDNQIIIPAYKNKIYKIVPKKIERLLYPKGSFILTSPSIYEII